MTADEASMLPETELRPWVNHAELEKPHLREVENLEKALILCTPYKIGPFQSEIDRKLDMNDARIKFGLGPMPKKADLVRELLNEKPLEMARPLGDAYSEYFLKEKGLIAKDSYLEEGWDKEKLPTEKEMFSNNEEPEQRLEDDDEINMLLAFAAGEGEGEEEGEEKGEEKGEGKDDDDDEEEYGEEKKEEGMSGSMTPYDPDPEIMAKLLQAELEAEQLKTKLMEQHALEAREENNNNNNNNLQISPRAMPSDIRKKYVAERS